MRESRFSHPRSQFPNSRRRTRFHSPCPCLRPSTSKKRKLHERSHFIYFLCPIFRTGQPHFTWRQRGNRNHSPLRQLATSLCIARERSHCFQPVAARSSWHGQCTVGIGLMRIPTLTIAWLLSLPALAIGQSPTPIPDPLPVHHDSVEVNDTAAGVQESSSPATTIKPAEVKDLPSRPATVNDTLPLLPGIIRLPSGGLQINGSGNSAAPCW